MVKRTKHSSNLVEFSNIPGNIEAILQLCGLDVKPFLPGNYMVNFEEAIGDTVSDLFSNTASYSCAEEEGAQYFGFFQWNAGGIKRSTLYVLGNNAEANPTIRGFTEYTGYLESLGQIIDTVEGSFQLNKLGMQKILEKMLLFGGKELVPEGPAVQIYNQVKEIYDKLDDMPNQVGILTQLKAVYKEVAGIEYKEPGDCFSE